MPRAKSLASTVSPQLSVLACPLLTKEEKKLLSYFVTNLYGNVYGFKNLPQVVMGAIFAAYSRSPLSAREILVKKFLGDEEFMRLTGEIDRFLESVEKSKPMINPEKAESFYDRVLVQYGDDSVAELGVTHMAIENVSQIVVKLIEDRRIGLNPLEKSTRYVQFNEKNDLGQYNYYRDEKLMNSSLGSMYIDAMDTLFETYTKLYDPLTEHIKAKFPQQDGQSDTAYASALRAQVCDVLRYLLPMGTFTNMGVVGNGRAYEYLIQCLLASPFTEAHDIATKLLDELRQVLPAFVRRMETERGKESIDYLKKRKQYETKLPSLENSSTLGGPFVRLIDYDKDGETRVAAGMLFESSHAPLDAIQKQLAQKSKAEVRDMLRQSYALRGYRTHKPSRAFEHTTYAFDIMCDIGAYRDLHRHRILTQQRQSYTTLHGYLVPQDIIEMGAESQYRAAMDKAHDAFTKISKKLPDQSQYVVPFGYFIRFTMRMNAREAVHLCELRSTLQGHWSYRFVAQEMARLIAEVHPSIGDGMMIDWSEGSEMARIKSEQRQEEKLKKIGLERDY